MKEKEHTYYYTDKRKTYSSQELGRFLRENNISPTEAVNIIKKYKLKENKGDSRTDCFDLKQKKFALIYTQTQ